MDDLKKKLRQKIFEQQNASASACLEPAGVCSNDPIRAHSIQNAVTLDQLCAGGHVIMPKLEWKSSGPRIVFKSVGRNHATTFTGLCELHDNVLFEPIDKHPIDVTNKRQLFLLAYRSVLRELHAVASGALQNQLGYQKSVDLELIDGSVPTPEGMRATGFIINAIDTHLYKQEFDLAYIAGTYDNVRHFFRSESGYLPTAAASALFSLDDIEVRDDVARIALNVFPLNGGVTAVFSYLADEEEHLLPFLEPLMTAPPDEFLHLLSARILLSCENFVLNPEFWKRLDEPKRRRIESLFIESMFIEPEHVERVSLFEKAR